jgi:hypothetical protein
LTARYSIDVFVVIGVVGIVGCLMAVGVGLAFLDAVAPLRLDVLGRGLTVVLGAVGAVGAESSLSLLKMVMLGSKRPVG